MTGPPVVLCGPTASGKSDVALAAALATGGVEIVSLDAMQVYRRMDVGTAKPTPAERAAVPHHAIDLVEPSADWTVAQHQAACAQALTGIEARGARALLVGGTGLYVRALVDGLAPPGSWPDVRAELEAQAAAGPDAVRALHRRLLALDPPAATKMEPTNARRIVRALEVCLGSGRPFSASGPGLDAYPPSDIVQIGLRWSRPELAARIETRVHRMVAAGLVDEVQALLAEPLGLSRTARQALGYKEVIDHLEGRCGLDEAVGTIVSRTRRFAVRQERWFRRDPRIRWVALAGDPLIAVPTVMEALSA